MHGASGDAGLPFSPATASIGKIPLTSDVLETASKQLLLFMANRCELSASKQANHGTGSIEYLSDFILPFSAFGNSLKVFTTNIDLCFEAAMVRLSQRPRLSPRPDLILVDGFDTGLITTFDLRNYRREFPLRNDLRPVYYWKLHGSIDWTFSSPIDVIDVNNNAERLHVTPTFSDESIIVRRLEDKKWEELYNCGALSSPVDSCKERIVVFPTPAKYLQTYTFPYMDLFEAFRRTLEEIELLIMIGTSFPD